MGLYIMSNKATIDTLAYYMFYPHSVCALILSDIFRVTLLDIIRYLKTIKQ